MRRLTRTATVLALLGAVTVGPTLAAPGTAYAWGGEKERKVTICHVPPGNPDNAHTITVGASAVRAHLGHGDYLGPCKKKSKY